jgi:hypothetical protein
MFKLSLKEAKACASYYALSEVIAEIVDSLCQPCQRMELLVRVKYKTVMTSLTRSIFVLGFP